MESLSKFIEEYPKFQGFLKCLPNSSNLKFLFFSRCSFKANYMYFGLYHGFNYESANLLTKDLNFAFCFNGFVCPL